MYRKVIKFWDQDINVFITKTGEKFSVDNLEMILPKENAGMVYTLQGADDESVKKFVIAFNQDLSRKIYAASDIYLMPSKSEPCGLAQMIASRYGAIPITRETGGLNDSIVDFGTGHGNGWTFKNYSARDLIYVVRNAVEVFHNHKEAWNDLRNIVFSVDFSWEKSADEYLKIYHSLM